MPINNEAIIGLTTREPIRFATGQFNKGPANSRAANLGNPRMIGIKGAPRRIRGGENIIKIMCCSMWAVSKNPLKTSSGEASATQSEPSPPKKATILQPGKKATPACRKNRHPRRYTTAQKTIANVAAGGIDQELRKA